MLGKFQIRTDLALEAKEGLEAKNHQIRGVKIETKEDSDTEITTTTVVIETENGAKAMGKPVGTYITMEAPNMSSEDEDYHREISKELSLHLKKLIGNRKSVLIVGLGNREVTPDALGPRVVGNIEITRHLVRAYGNITAKPEEFCEVSALVPGVMAQTGMETLEIIKGVVKETEPEIILAVDALAARSTRRLSRTIQITDTGINPGSGVGNHRNGINQQELGVPVVAIGVPMVVDAATIVRDAMEALVESLEPSEQIKVYEGISSHLNTLYVTPKDIDETVKRISFTISEGINLTFSSYI